MVVWLSNRLKSILAPDEGVTAIEYALLGGLVSVFIIVALSLVGQQVQTTFEIWTTAVHDAVNKGGS